jgi:WD40 repeat protein
MPTMQMRQIHPTRLLLSRLTLLSLLMLFLLSFTLTHAQEDGLNLPTELYTLINEGQVQRYGLGASGLATVSPDDAVVVDFGIAPDGVLLAYRTEAGLSVRNMLTDETQEIETTTAGIPPFRGRGATIAWSPEGGALAYTEEYGIRLYFPSSGAFFDLPISPILNLIWSPDGRFLAAEAEDNIWWVYRREGDSMILTSAIPSSVGLDWVGPALLMFAPAEGGLFLMDVGNGNAQSQLSANNLLFRQPSVRRDGSVSIFARSASDTQLAPTAAFLYRVVPTSEGGDIEQLSKTEVDLDGLRWAPGGTLLLALRGGVLALVDPMSGQGFTLPATGVVSYGWGGLRDVPVASLPLTTAAYFIADDGTGVDQLWRVSQDGAQGIPVVNSETPVEQFAIAPSGINVVYLSGGQLWVYVADANAPEALIEVEDSTAIQNLSLSFDGSTVYYDDGTAIYALPVAGGVPEQVLTGYTEPKDAPDGSSLLVRIGDGDYGVLVRETGEVRRLGTFRWIKWLSAEQFIAYGTFTVGGQPGVYLLENADGTAPQLIYTPPAGQRAVDAAPLADTIVRILFTGEDENAPSPVFAVEVGVDGSLVAQPRTIGYLTESQLSADGQFVAGYTSGDGSVALHDINSGSEVVLRLPSRIRQFNWSIFR